MSLDSFPPDPDTYAYGVEAESRGLGTLDWETFHGVVNNKVRHFDKVVIGKVVQSYSRMKSKSKYGLLPDNILYNDYISCFAVSCSRWLPTAWCQAAASC